MGVLAMLAIKESQGFVGAQRCTVKGALALKAPRSLKLYLLPCFD